MVLYPVFHKVYHGLCESVCRWQIQCLCHLNPIPSPGYAINHPAILLWICGEHFCADNLTSGYFVAMYSQVWDYRVKGNEAKSLGTEWRGGLHPAVPRENLWQRWLSWLRSCRPGRVLKFEGTLEIASSHTLFVVFQIGNWVPKRLSPLQFWGTVCHFWHMCKPSTSLSESSPDGPDLARPSGSRLGLFLEIKLHHDTEDGMARRLAAQLEGRLCSSGAWEPERVPPSPSADYI